MTTKKTVPSEKKYDDSIKKLTETTDLLQKVAVGHEERLDEIVNSLTYVKEILDSLMLVNKATRIIMKDLSDRVGLTSEALEQLNMLPLDEDEEETKEN